MCPATLSQLQGLPLISFEQEQKIFDVAGCLSDVLSCTPNLGPQRISDGHNMLHGFMRLLAGFRNKESLYLQPLLSKAASILAAAMPVPLPLTLPSETNPLEAV